MIALLLERAGLDPTAVIGGRLSAFGSNARLGRGQYIVVEADESDRSFLKLSPAIAVITNIDREHIEAYGSFDGIVDAFQQFADRIPFYGAVVACADNPAVRALVPTLARRVITYGFSEGLGRARHSSPKPTARPDDAWSATACAASPRATSAERLQLNVPGRHNLQNALAAIAVGVELGVPFDRITSGARRLPRRRAPLSVARRGARRPRHRRLRPSPHRDCGGARRRAWRSSGKRLVAVFQPHRFTRTRDLMEDFGPALAGADVVRADRHLPGR